MNRARAALLCLTIFLRPPWLARCLALCLALASCPAPHREQTHPMPALVTAPVPADAEPVPGGVAAPDGSELYLRGTGGIDAIDPDTGALRWHTAVATVPVLALPDVLLAFAADPTGDVSWTGPARLVAIDRAPPHAARTGPPFELPLDRRRVLDARVTGGALDVWWFAEPDPRNFLTQLPPSVDGSVHLDLTTGAATVSARGWVPDAIRTALTGVTVWSAVGAGFAPWRAGDGWSVVALVQSGATSTPSLRHWPASGPDTTVPLLAQRHIGWAQVEHADRHHLFLRVCEPGVPPVCELRVLDTVTGAAIATTPSPPPPADRLEPPYALLGRRLLATRSAPPGPGRVVVAVDVDRGTELWRLMSPPPPGPPP
jgi:hypothetical protein